MPCGLLSVFRRFRAVLVVIPLCVAAPAAHGHSIWITNLVRDCATAVDDTVRFDVMLDNSVSPIDGGTLWISATTYGDGDFTFVWVDRGELTQGWNWTWTTPYPWSIHIDVSGSTPIPPGSSGVLLHVKAISTCCPEGIGLDNVLVPYGFGDFDINGLISGHFKCVKSEPGLITAESGYKGCDGSVDTALVHVRLDNTPAPIDNGGFIVHVDGYYNGSLTYAGWDRGDLTAAWDTFDVTVTDGGINGSSVVVSGANSTPIPPGTTGTFIVVRYVINCCTQGWKTGTRVEVDNPTGDLAGYLLQDGEWNCTQVATKPMTWGKIKALYR